MTVRIYQSTDASAPTLSGQAGTLVDVLDACLVNGYGSQTAAGWTKSFTASNKAVYRAPTGTQYYLRVDDTASLVTARYALLRGYETMSDIDTGTNGFPTTGQLPNGMQIQKSSSVDANSRSWCVIAHERSFYLFTAPNTTGISNWATASIAATPSDSQFFFGEILSFKSADAYNCFLITHLALAAQVSLGTFSLWGSSSQGHYGARTASGAVVSQGTSAVFAHSAAFQTAILNAQSNGLFPEITTNEAGIGCIEIIEHTDTSFSPARIQFRGRMPGLWGGNTSFVPNGGVSASPKQGPFCAVQGTGAFTGRTFMPVILGNLAGVMPNGGVGWIELTDNWYTV